MFIKDALLAVVEEVTKTVVSQLDPFGSTTMKDAAELIGDPERAGNLTIREAERIYGLTALMTQAHVGMQNDMAQIGEEVTDKALIEKIARANGLDPSQIRAFRPPKGQFVDTVNGPIPTSEIPLNEQGEPDEEWVNANCNCDDHKAARAAKSTKSAKAGDGGYL